MYVFVDHYQLVAHVVILSEPRWWSFGISENTILVAFINNALQLDIGDPDESLLAMDEDRVEEAASPEPTTPPASTAIAVVNLKLLPFWSSDPEV